MAFNPKQFNLEGEATVGKTLQSKYLFLLFHKVKIQVGLKLERPADTQGE